MIQKRKLAAALMSVVLVCSSNCFSAIPAFAYDDCDVNHNGVVDVSDAVYISRYLGGSLYESDYQVFDVNKSLIIDQADVDCVLASIASLSYYASYYSRENNSSVHFPSVTYPIVKDSYANAVSSRTYQKYSYETHQVTGSYVLSPSTSVMTSGEMSSPNTIIGGYDDRVQANGAENEGIVHLSGGGTGFIVDDHVIATCAHYVYDDNLDCYKDDVEINTYNSDGTISSTTLTPVECHIPMAHLTSDDPIYDYALISVEEDLYFDYVQFSLAASYNVTVSDFGDIPIYVTGCPGEHHIVNGQGTDNSDLDLYTDEGTISGNSDGKILYYNADTSGCQSGSPVYTIVEQERGGTTTYIYAVLAIHSGYDDEGDVLCNCGPRITKYQLQFYHNNPNINY